MSTQFPVLVNERFLIELDERAYKFDVDVVVYHLPANLELPVILTVPSLDESAIIDMAVQLLGPLFYYNPGPHILEEFTKRLRERGYTC